jgi:hypothetical protein
VRENHNTSPQDRIDSQSHWREQSNYCKCRWDRETGEPKLLKEDNSNLQDRGEEEPREVRNRNHPDSQGKHFDQLEFGSFPQGNPVACSSLPDTCIPHHRGARSRKTPWGNSNPQDTQADSRFSRVGSSSPADKKYKNLNLDSRMMRRSSQNHKPPESLILLRNRSQGGKCRQPQPRHHLKCEREWHLRSPKQCNVRENQ